MKALQRDFSDNRNQKVYLLVTKLQILLSVTTEVKLCPRLCSLVVLLLHTTSWSQSVIAQAFVWLCGEQDWERESVSRD